MIKCADPEPVRQFYAETLGLAVYREFPGGTVFFAGNGLLEVSGGPEATTSPEGAQEPKKNHELALWLQVRDIHDTVAELARGGVPIMREPRKEPWGLLEAWIADPIGTRIVLVQIPHDHPLRADTR